MGSSPRHHHGALATLRQMYLLLIASLSMVAMVCSESTLTLLLVLQHTSDPIHVTHTLTASVPHIDSYHIVYIGHDGDDAILTHVRQQCEQLFTNYHGVIHTTGDSNMGVLAAGNIALKLARDDDAAFALWLEPGDELPAVDDNTYALHQWVQDAAVNDGADGFTVTLDYEWRVPEVRIIRLSAEWRFVGSEAHPHVLPGQHPTLPASRIHPAHVVLGCARDLSDDDRRHMIVQRLSAMCDGDAQNSIATFYLASILFASGNMTGALFYYQRRWHQYSEDQRWHPVDSGTNDGNALLASCRQHEDAYVTMMNIARIREAQQQPWHSIQQAYHDAADVCALRAEPLIYIATHWFDLGKHALCFLHASRASHLAYPTWARLTVDASVYEWRSDMLVAISGWAIGQLDVGASAALRVTRYINDAAITQATPLTSDIPDVAAIQSHVELYRSRVGSVRWQQMTDDSNNRATAAAASSSATAMVSRTANQWLSSSISSLSNTDEPKPTVAKRRRSSSIPSMGVTRETMPSIYHWVILVLSAIGVRYCLWPSGFTAINRAHRKPAV